MRAADLDAVVALADRVHVEHPEAPAVFAERLRLFPAGCFVLARMSAVLGYAIAHPGRIGVPPALNTLLGALPTSADCLYLHDIALAPEAARRGHGHALLPHLVALATQHGLATLALIAVSGSAPFWHKLGFRPTEQSTLASRLASYGAGALYMTRPAAEIKRPDGL